MQRSTNKRKLLTLLSILLAFVLIAASCSDDDDDGDSSTTTEAADDGAAEDGEAEDAEAEDAMEEEDGEAEDGDTAAGDDTVRIGIIGECEGTFGSFHEDTVAGASLAIINASGATSNSTTSALEGWTGAEISGVPIELAGIGCGDETKDTALAEVRKLVEQDGANVVLGPLSGDEGIAVAEYAIDHPEVTFINGISGGQDATLHVQADNFFRYNNDGAQWNAGIGDILYNDLGWRTAAVIMDDYSFGHTSAAGFIADFCGVGGDVVSRVYPPRGTTDYSSFIQQLPDPDEVDGYFWVVGGEGTVPAMQAFVDAKGELNGAQHAGNLFISPALGTDFGTALEGAHIGGFATPPGDMVGGPAVDDYLASADAAWETIEGGPDQEPNAPSASAGGGFMYGYYAGGLAFTTAFEQVEGDLSDDHAALRDALSNLELDAPYASVSLDENRQAISDTWVRKLVIGEDGELAEQTIAVIPDVDQTFGGTFSADTPPPGQGEPECVPAELPWAGNAIPVTDGVAQD
jgi:branched-chain amino acid transport system substrate-binding protein